MKLVAQTLDFTKPKTIESRFAEFHALNPHVYENLEEDAFRWVNRTGSKFGISMLWERLRWDIGMSTNGDTHKLNNNFRAHYARLLIENHPEWESLLEIRELRSA